MANNPCTEYEDFRRYVAAFLPTLVWYEYKKIHDEERETGVVKFRQLIIGIILFYSNDNKILLFNKI